MQRVRNSPRVTRLVSSRDRVHTQAGLVLKFMLLSFMLLSASHADGQWHILQFGSFRLLGRDKIFSYVRRKEGNPNLFPKP